MFWILMTSLTDQPLILQWEVWLRSLLGLKGFIKANITLFFLVTTQFSFTHELHFLVIPWRSFDWSLLTSANCRISRILWKITRGVKLFSLFTCYVTVWQLIHWNKKLFFKGISLRNVYCSVGTTFLSSFQVNVLVVWLPFSEANNIYVGTAR